MKRIGGVSILDLVVKACRKSQVYINKFSSRTGQFVDIAVLIPKDDPLKSYLAGRVDIVEGPEDDVLARYKNAMDRYNPDYLVRVTSDCPLLPPFLVSKAINVAVRGEQDFVTSAHPAFRTFFDGADIQIVNKRLFDWVDENATGDQREHVLSILDNEKPDWARVAGIFNYLDLSGVKLSIDTLEDYEKVKKQIESTATKKRNFEKTYGRGSVHQF
jgi:spore coat polysaccharide biosynthesis protein SpsF (cytidylyltransferase family)